MRNRKRTLPPLQGEGDRRAVEGFLSEELGMMYISNC